MILGLILGIIGVILLICLVSTKLFCIIFLPKEHKVWKNICDTLDYVYFANNTSYGRKYHSIMYPEYVIHTDGKIVFVTSIEDDSILATYYDPLSKKVLTKLKTL